MSLVNLSFTHVNNTAYEFPAHDGNGPGTAVAYACQATNSPGTPGLLGSLALGLQDLYSSMTCIPAAIASH